MTRKTAPARDQRRTVKESPHCTVIRFPSKEDLSKLFKNKGGSGEALVDARFCCISGAFSRFGRGNYRVLQTSGCYSIFALEHIFELVIYKHGDMSPCIVLVRAENRTKEYLGTWIP